MRHSQVLPTRACGRVKRPGTSGDQETAPGLPLHLCLKRNKKTSSLLRLDYHPVRTRFDLVVRLALVNRLHKLNPVVVTSFRR